MILTLSEVEEIKEQLGSVPLLDNSLAELRERIDNELLHPIDVPVPKDPAGGYTHEKHKQNYHSMQGAGILWQISGDRKYADYVKEMLLRYARMYPELELHPLEKSYAPGKLFWQSLNEAVWLVYTSQAYDCVYDYLSPEERKKIENNLLIPYADFLSVGSPNVFNRIHNHGVWAVAAVGMAGFAMENEEIANRSFTGVPPYENESGTHPGFFTQINKLFSPDGYYTEGPYYQRYALLPYLLLAQSIDNNRPELGIFEYRDSILRKAVLTTLQLTDTRGRFFPINDAMKSMSYMAPELIAGLDIIYKQDPTKYELLGVAQEQGEVMISGAGLKVAMDIAEGKAESFIWQSLELDDGSEGDKGAIGILRSSPGKDGQALVMKYPSQGMDHGHFDRLALMYYDGGDEILQDYGAARYVNVLYKRGGRYLPENDSWAKQSIAHNTVVVDFESQFRGNLKKASETDAEKWIFDIERPGVKVMSAKENHGYDGVEMQRTLVMIDDKSYVRNTLILDIFRIESEDEHVYDLPYYYQGQLMYTNVDYKAHLNSRAILGENNGYQHLWIEADGKASTDNLHFLFLNNHRFYSITTEANKDMSVFFTRIGANDPEFNLRNEPAYLIRQSKRKDHLFVSTLESHGTINPVTEITSNLSSSVQNIMTLLNNQYYTIVEFTMKDSITFIFALANSDNSPETSHSVEIDNAKIEWTGAYNILKLK